MNNTIKILIAFNESAPEMYDNLSHMSVKKLGFEPVFDIEDLNPLLEYQKIADLLTKKGYKSDLLNIKDDIEILIDYCNTHNPDVIFNFIEIYKDNSKYEMNAVGVLELLKIPYTGSTPTVLANCQNKALTKSILKSLSINTPEFKLFQINHFVDQIDMVFPLIVKPGFEDASTGVENKSIVNNIQELNTRLNHIYTIYSQPALVEEFIEGRELNVSILGNEDPIVLPISEIDFSEMPKHLHKIVSYQAKWEPDDEAYHKTIPICPAEIPIETEIKVKELALLAYKAMNVRDYARVDIRLSNKNIPYVLEVNPNPDITEGVGFMRSADTLGILFEEALVKIVKLALKRADKSI